MFRTIAVLFLALLWAFPCQAVPEVRRPGIDIVQVKVTTVPNSEGRQVQVLVWLENFSEHPAQADLEVTIVAEDGHPNRLVETTPLLESGERYLFRSLPFRREADQEVVAEAELTGVTIVER